MALELVLVRHGDALSGKAGIKDIDRTLSHQGIIGSVQMASKLLQEGFDPEAVYTSPAARAMHTAMIFTRTLQKGTNIIELVDDLYYGTSSTIIEWITETYDGIKSLVIVGHNPGITEIVNTLSQGRSAFMPTNGIAWFKFDTASWGKVPESNLASFRFFAPPGDNDE